MALVGTGKWAKGPVTTSVDDRDFFSGSLSITNTAYDLAHTYEFGFSTPEVHLINTSATPLVFQWLSRTGGADSGVVPANTTLSFRSANKQGIRLRVDSGTATGFVICAG
jgi:hypothetical protein